MTPELEEAMHGFLAGGKSIVEACQLTGIARKTWYRHLDRQGRAA